MSDFGMVKTVKARKDHRCIWCRGVIAKGELHPKYVGMFDGEFQDWRMHTDCHTVANRVTENEEPFCDGKHERGKGCGECDPAGLKRGP